MRKNLKNISKKFGDYKKVRIFAARFERDTVKNKFIEKTVRTSTSKYREKRFNRERRFLSWPDGRGELKKESASGATKNYMIYYTMKSLILAQDER